MWSNARGRPRVNGGGPLAVLATSVCSGRGGRRLVFWCPKGGRCCLKGGLPPTPPLDDPLVCLKGGLPPTPPLDDPLGDLGAGVAGGGLCRVGCGVPPQALASVAGCARSPSPPPSPARGEGAGCARVGCGRLRRSTRVILGAWGAQAPGVCHPGWAAWVPSDAADAAFAGTEGGARCALGGLSAGGRRTPSDAPDGFRLSPE